MSLEVLALSNPGGENMFRASIQVVVVLYALFVNNGAKAESLAEQVAKVCIAQNAAPTYIDFDSPELGEYCRCEANIWAERGSELQLRSVMTFMTDNHLYMKGQVYNYDRALDFIVQHSATVEAACEPK